MTRPLYRDYSAIEADLPALLEIARLALADHRFATEVLEEELDMDLWETQQRLEAFMDAPSPAGSTGSPLARAVALVGKEYNPHMEDKQIERIYKSYGHVLDQPEIKDMLAKHAYAIGQQFAYDNGEPDFHAAGLAAEQAVYQEG